MVVLEGRDQICTHSSNMTIVVELTGLAQQIPGLEIAKHRKTTIMADKAAYRTENPDALGALQ